VSGGGNTRFAETDALPSVLLRKLVDNGNRCGRQAGCPLGACPTGQHCPGFCEAGHQPGVRVSLSARTLHCAPSASRSALSWVRPVARLFLMKASLPMKATGTRVARVAVERERESTDDDVLNALRVERFDKLSQILLKRHRLPSGQSRSVPGGSSAFLRATTGGSRGAWLHGPAGGWRTWLQSAPLLIF